MEKWYGKLPVIFITLLASEKNGTTNGVIAEYLLKNGDILENLSIVELAKSCNVGTGTISRFCRDIGLSDFGELKELMLETKLEFQRISYCEKPSDRLKDYKSSTIKSIEMVAESIDMKKIEKLCKNIKNYQKVAVFGLLKSGGVAVSLQSDLLMLGKSTVTKLSYSQQMDYIKSADEEDLIIIFSYKGVYFDYEFRKLPVSLKKPKIYLITGGENHYGPLIDEVINFNSELKACGHPCELQFVADIISQEYARFLM